LEPCPLALAKDALRPTANVFADIILRLLKLPAGEFCQDGRAANESLPL
jgi:hypothetical protein